MKDIVVGRISERHKEVYSRSYDKTMTLNWKFPDGKDIRTHMSYNSYGPPEGMGCDGNCKKFWYLEFNRGRTDWYFAETKMQFTYDPWYFFGSDFQFSNAEGNFWFLEKV